MPANTPVLALPYPLGTDKIMDGDNVIQALAERIEARLPRGHLSRVDLTSSPGAFAARGDVPGLTMTVNLYAGRWYRARVRGYAGLNTNGRFGCYLMLDGTQLHAWVEDVLASNFASFECVQEFQTTTASHVVKVQADCLSATATLYANATQKMSFCLEDLGAP